jgi:hypothetical protein
VITDDHRQNIIKANQKRRGESHRCPEGCTCDRHKVYYRGGSKKGRIISPEAQKRIAEGIKNRVLTDEGRQRLVEEMSTHRGDPEFEAKRVAALQKALTGRTCPIGCTCGKHTTPPTLPVHRNSDGRKGYIYIIEFSTGVVKVGRTTSPRQRIDGQLYTASKLGVEPTNIWLSAFHEDYKANEVELLGLLGAPARGTEYFRVEYSHVVKLAEAIIQRYENL